MRSIVSYAKRGPWGRNDYPGNCSGYLVRDLIQFYRPKRVVDPAEGSGTTGDVCREFKVPYLGRDLSRGFDLATASLDDLRLFRPELVFFHPPYWKIVRYSGNAWGDLPDIRDLSQEDDWETYLKRLHTMVEHCRSITAAAGRVAVLIGDVREQGRYYSAQAALHHWYGPKVVEAVVIKAQHHVTSDGRQYAGTFVRIMHETCVVLRAPGAAHG